MSDWQVHLEVIAKVSDCKNAEEAEARIRRCLPAGTFPSIKEMQIIRTNPAKLVVECGAKEFSIKRDPSLTTEREQG